MPASTWTRRRLKDHILSLLGADDWQQQWTDLTSQIDGQKLVSPLFSALCSSDSHVRWHAITCFGWLIPSLAETHMESARVVMRRFLWSLNDESGGIGWGAPEAMGEIMAAHSKLAQEYHRILLSFIHESDGPDNYLEYAPLRRGAYWAIARLAHARPELVRPSQADVEHALHREEDPEVLLLTCLALSPLGPVSVAIRPRLQDLAQRSDTLTIYWQTRFQPVHLGPTASRVLEQSPQTD